MKSEELAITVRFHRPIKNQWLVFPLIVLILMLLAACGPEASSAPDSPPSAQTVMEQARQAMEAVQSYRFTAEIIIMADEAVPKTRLEGEWASPGNSRLRVSKVGSNDVILQEFVSVAGRTLGRFPEITGRDWIRIDPPVVWALPIDRMFPELNDSEVMEGEIIDGMPMYYVTGLDEQVVPNSVLQVFQASHYSLFIDQETMLLRRLVINTEIRTEFGAPGLEGEAAGQELIDSSQYSQSATYNYFGYNEPVAIELPPFDPCNFSAEARELLGCGRFTQRVYWLGDRLEITGSPKLEFDGAWVSYGNDVDVIMEDSRLTVVYRSEDNSVGVTKVYIEQWSRPAWTEYLAQFSGYDAETVPASGPVNWWQHPCVEEEVYTEANGAEVHLFKAHLVSLVFIYPMTDEQISQCRDEPVRAWGAHVYFKDTVIEFSMQDSVSPGGPPATVSPLGFGSRRPDRPPYPELIVRDRNPYNNVETVRLIAASLKPYENP